MPLMKKIETKVHKIVSAHLVTQKANQPVTWQQFNAFNHVDMRKRTYGSSNGVKEQGRKAD